MWYVHLEFRQASVTLKFVNAYINLLPHTYTYASYGYIYMDITRHMNPYVIIDINKFKL